MELLEASSVRRDETIHMISNYRTRYAEKEEHKEDFSISTVPGQKLKPVVKQITLL